MPSTTSTATKALRNNVATTKLRRHKEWRAMVHRRLISTLESVEKNNVIRKLPPISDPISYFFSVQAANISPSQYATRLRRYAKCSDTVYIHALVLLRRLAKSDPRLKLSPYNAHRLLITALVISAKFVEHAWYSNKYYAAVGGISSVREMNNLEVEMLKLLDYRVLVTPSEIIAYCSEPVAGDYYCTVDVHRM